MEEADVNRAIGQKDVRFIEKVDPAILVDGGIEQKLDRL